MDPCRSNNMDPYRPLQAMIELATPFHATKEQILRASLQLEEPAKQKSRKFGSLEDAKRLEYEEEIRKNPLNCDTWFDYIKLEGSLGNIHRIREIYERALATMAPAEAKDYSYASIRGYFMV